MSQSSPIVLITGASRGIGADLVKHFLLNTNFIVIALSRSKLPAEKFSQQNRLIYLQGDISSPDDVKKLKDLILKVGNVSYIINNAALLIKKPFKSFNNKEILQIFEVNFVGPAMLIRELLSTLARPAHIVNITSMGGYQGSAKFPGLSIYSASKAALNILSECLAEEFKSENIFVNALALGAVQTEMLNEAFPGYQAPVSSADMAAFISDFTQNGYRFINGKILPISLNTP